MLKQFFHKKLPISTHYYYCTSSTAKFRIPKEFRAPYYSLYNVVGLPKLTIEDGEKYFGWYLNNQMVESRNPVIDQNGDIIQDKLQIRTPNFANVKFTDDKMSPYKFLLSKIKPQCYVAHHESQDISAIPTDYQFFWNPKILTSYEEMLKNNKNQNCQIIGPKNMGKSFNLIFYTFLHRLYRNQVCKVLLIRNPKQWLSQNHPIPILIKELQMTFGEELSFKNHPLHDASLKTFKRILRIKDKNDNNIEKQTSEIMNEVKTLLKGKKLYYFQDESNTFTRFKYSQDKILQQKADNIQQIRQILSQTCNKSLQIDSTANEIIQNKNPKTAYKCIFCKISSETGRYMLNETNKDNKFTYKQVSQVLETIGQYPGQIIDFAKQKLSLNSAFEETLDRFQQKQIKNIKQDYDSFKMKHREDEQRRNIDSFAATMTGQMIHSKKIDLDLEYTDLRYFDFNEIQKEVVPLYPAVKLFYEKYFSNNDEVLESLIFRLESELNNSNVEK